MATPNVFVFEEYVNKNSYKAEDKHIEFPIILSIVVLLSLIGNILVVVVSVFCMRHRSLTTILILNLALSDLLFTVGLVFRICYHIWGWTLEYVACVVVQSIFSVGFYSNIVFLVLLSVQRYGAIMHPLSRWKKGCCISCILFIVWMVSIWAALLATVYYSGGYIYSRKTVFINIMYKENIVFLCAFLFMSVCYIRILRTIFKSPPSKKNRITGLTFLLVATFFICWAPYNIVTFLDTLSYARYICHLLALTRCCLNPVMYGLFGVKFRKDVREIFQRRATPNSGQMRMEECHLTRSVLVRRDLS